MHSGVNDSVTTSAQRTRSSTTARPSGLLEVEREHELAGVGRVEERRVLGADLAAEEGGDRAADVEATARLDADHGGAVVGEHARRERARDRPHEVEHLHAVERAVERPAASNARRARRPALGADLGRVLAEPRRAAPVADRRAPRTSRTAPGSETLAPSAASSAVT